jgi:hypothetical protein
LPTAHQRCDKPVAGASPGRLRRRTVRLVPLTELQEVRYLIQRLTKARSHGGFTPADEDRLDELLAVESSLMALAKWRERPVPAEAVSGERRTTRDNGLPQHPGRMAG